MTLYFVIAVVYLVYLITYWIIFEAISIDETQMEYIDSIALQIGFVFVRLVFMQINRKHTQWVIRKFGDLLEQSPKINPEAPENLVLSITVMRKIVHQSTVWFSSLSVLCECSTLHCIRYLPSISPNNSFSTPSAFPLQLNLLKEPSKALSVKEGTKRLEMKEVLHERKMFDLFMRFTGKEYVNLLCTKHNTKHSATCIFLVNQFNYYIDTQVLFGMFIEHR